MQLARSSLHFAQNRMTPYVANVIGNQYTSTYFFLSRLSDRLIFRNSLSLFGSGILEKKTSTCHSTLLTIASACVNVHNSRTIMKVNVW